MVKKDPAFSINKNVYQECVPMYHVAKKLAIIGLGL